MFSGAIFFCGRKKPLFRPNSLMRLFWIEPAAQVAMAHSNDSVPQTPGAGEGATPGEPKT
jgi:hypothetical protein